MTKGVGNAAVSISCPSEFIMLSFLAVWAQPDHVNSQSSLFTQKLLLITSLQAMV